jgi:hypothetical protein
VLKQKLYEILKTTLNMEDVELRWVEFSAVNMNIKYIITK